MRRNWAAAYIHMKTYCKTSKKRGPRKNGADCIQFDSIRWLTDSD